MLSCRYRFRVYFTSPGKLIPEGVIHMDKRYSTGNKVGDDGTYICEAGEMRLYQKGQTFEACPVTDKKTKWRKVRGNDI
jgi:hypothetical protein